MRLLSVTTRGFRAFGREPQTIECDGPLALVFGRNSKGKSSLVEGIEFLLTGRTTRVQLHDGSSSEFESCLRNVHLAPDEEVYVEAVVEIDGNRYVTRRTLDEDFTKKGECKGTLTVDGSPAPGIEGTGIVLSPPPFETPVLMQHALRFVLSTKPQSRADYLKAVLDVSDLDEVRAVIAAQVKAIEAPSTPVLNQFQVCQQHSVFGAALRNVDLASTAEIERGLADAVRRLVVPRDGAGLSNLATQLHVELEKRRTAVFPTASLRVQVVSVPTWPTFAAVAEFAKAEKPTSLDKSPAVRSLLKAVLDVPHITSAHEALDCPVCLTGDALTPNRVQEIRDAFTGNEKAQQLAAAARREIDSTRRDVESLAAALSSERPSAVAWTNEQKQGYADSAESLLPGEGATTIKELFEAAILLKAPRQVASDRAQEFSALVKVSLDSFQAGESVDADALVEEAQATNKSIAVLAEAQRVYSQKAGPFLTRLEAALATATATQGWAQLLRLIEDHQKIPAEHREAQAHAALVKEAARAQKAIDQARGQLLDTNFESLSDEISRWWNLLRPEEPIKFSKIQRRGTGIRHVDLTALLSPEPASAGVERHAAGVFSDSQLNALGLSIFLARAMRAGMGFVVLDDPVPASDDEHRGQFARAVIDELLEGGVQVVLTTHDRNLSKRVQDLHGHIGIDGYEITMDTPGAGSSLIRRTDDLRSLLDAADDFVRHCLDSQLSDASNKVRKATERLCKDIIVKAHRAEGEDISTADLNENPGELVKMATPFLTKDPSHPGKLKHTITVTNPGSHDDPTGPARQDLKGVMGDLKKLRKDYCG